RPHVTSSLLNSTVWIPSSSEAFPFTVTFAYRRTVEFDGNVIVICGGIVSGIGSPGSTFTRIGADRVSDPLVPVTSTLNWPGVLPFITQAAVPEPGMLVGEQTVVTPVGCEGAVRPTGAVKPAGDEGEGRRIRREGEVGDGHRRAYFDGHEGGVDQASARACDRDRIGSGRRAAQRTGGRLASRDARLRARAGQPVGRGCGCQVDGPREASRGLQ